MTTDTANDMIKEKLQQLIDDSRASQQDDSDNVYAVDYNWLEPRVFDETQKGTMDRFGSKLSESIAVDLNSFFKSQTEVELNQTSTHFAQQAIEQLNELDSNRVSVGLTDGKNTCGIITITKDNAAELLKPILGEIENDELSLLEISLIEDIFAIVVDALKQSHPAMNFAMCDNLSIGSANPEFEPTLEVMKMEFAITDSIVDFNTKLEIVIDCSKLYPVVGKTISKAGFDSEDIENALMKCIDNTSVNITCECATQKLTVKQIMEIEPGDVVVLNRSINKPFVLKMDGKPVFHAKPCSLQGNYAVAIINPIISTDSEVTE